MHTSIHGMPIYYEQKGEGFPLLCIHGFPEDHRALLGCLEPLAPKLTGYRRIYVDLPGMGRSPANPKIRNADDMLKALHQFICTVIDGEDCLLVGQSYGGYLSMGLACGHRELIKGIFFLCPCTVANRSKRTLPPASAPVNSFTPVDGNAADYEDFLSMAAVASSSTWTRYKQEILPGLQCADAAFTERYQAEGYALSCEGDFPKISFERPATFLMGRQDNCVGYSDAFRLMDAFPHASFLVVDGAGHNLQIEQPRFFENSFLQWLGCFERES